MYGVWVNEEVFCVAPQIKGWCWKLEIRNYLQNIRIQLNYQGINVNIRLQIYKTGAWARNELAIDTMRNLFLTVNASDKTVHLPTRPTLNPKSCGFWAETKVMQLLVLMWAARNNGVHRPKPWVRRVVTEIDITWRGNFGGGRRNTTLAKY